MRTLEPSCEANKKKKHKQNNIFLKEWMGMEAGCRWGECGVFRNHNASLTSTPSCN